MYSTALIQSVAAHVGADFITGRKSIGHEIVNEQCVPVFKPIPECFQIDQIGVIQGRRGLATVDLARYQYIGNDNWLPLGSNCLSVLCMQMKLNGFD